MNKYNTASKPPQPEQPSPEGLDGAACSAWVEVSKADFDQYINDYPKPLEKDIARMCEPPMLTYNDFSGGKVWPQSVVAKAQLYDGSEYHGGRSPVYYLPNVKRMHHYPRGRKMHTG